MLRGRHVVAGALLVAGLALGAAAEAGDPPLSSLPAFPPFNPPPSSCTIMGLGSGKSVKFETDQSTAPFPEPTACPEGVQGACLTWRYLATYTGLDPRQPSSSDIFLSFDTDATVWAGTPAPLVGNPGQEVGNIMEGAFAERLLRFNTKQSGVCQPGAGGGDLRKGGGGGSFVCRVSFVTSNALVATMSAGFRQGTTNRTCAIAGAGDPVLVAGLSEPKRVVTTTLDCTVEWTQSADGCFLSATVLSGSSDCAIETGFQTAPVTNAATCATELNVPGSCKTCKWNSVLRSYTCVTRTNLDC
jgi:hypothetical protein